MPRTSHERLSDILSNASDTQCVHADHMVLLKAQLSTGTVFIKIGVSGECLLNNEDTAYRACADADKSTRMLCPLVIAYSPWLKVSTIRTDPTLANTVTQFITNLPQESYVDILVINSCGTRTMADFIAGNSTPMEISMMMTRCSDQIRRMNRLGVYHQDMHTRNIVISEGSYQEQLPCIIDFEFALTSAAPNMYLRPYAEEGVADNIKSVPHPRCDLHKFAYDVWVRTGNPTDGIIYTTVYAMMGRSPVGTTDSLATLPALKKYCTPPDLRSTWPTRRQICSHDIWSSTDNYAASYAKNPLSS